MFLSHWKKSAAVFAALFGISGAVFLGGCGTLSRKDPAYVPNAKAVKALDEQRKAGVLPAEVARVYDDLKKLGYAPDAANTNIGSAIFANKPGDGSAREQAASCQRVLGGAANFACEYATKRYRSNCINSKGPSV